MAGEKSPKKKISKLTEIKKPLIISSFVAAFAISGIIGGMYIFNITQKGEENLLLIGMGWFPNSFDPLYNPDDSSFAPNNMLWSQIIEGLFEHNQSREDTPIIPCLAKDLGTWSPDGLNFTVPLRENVKFHDGTSFNAAAVKWNFDRLYRFIDIMPWRDRWVWYYMYEFPDGRAIINETLVIDEYTVRFVLNDPYGPLRALLATFSSYFLSPTSTPENDYVDKFTGMLVGTGPFILDSYFMDPVYELGDNITLRANKNYWEGRPKIDKVHFQYVGEDDSFEKMVARELHYTPRTSNLTILEFYQNTPNFTAVSYPVPAVFFVGLNNDIFPVEIRKAMSYAFNYSHFNDMMYDGRYPRCKSPIPPGIIYSNWSLNIAYTNLTIARQTLINASWPGTGSLTANDNISAGNEWEKLVDDDTPLATYNFSMEEGRGGHMFQAYLLSTYFKQIGIKIGQNNLTPQDWYEGLIGGKLEFYMAGWGAAFNDPVEILNPLYMDYGEFNHYNFTDLQVQTWITDGMMEVNETKREQIYNKIQKTLVENLYPVIWTHLAIRSYVWSSNVKGIPIEGIPFKFILKYAYLEEV